MIKVAIKDSNNLVYFLDTKDVLNDEWINDAVVSVVFHDNDGDEVAGDVWPKPLDYQNDGKGNYIGILDENVQLRIGEFYTATIVVDAGVGLHLEETHDVQIVDEV